MKDDVDSEARERRANFRVDDEAYLVVEARDEAGPLPDSDWPSAFGLSARLYEMHQEATVLRRHAQRESATFYKLVEQLNRKLDLVMEVLLVQAFGDRPPPVCAVDVGAEGIGFVQSGSLPLDASVDLRMLFSSTGTGLRVAARVVRCDPAEDGRYAIGLHFDYAHERERELMVHHVLQRQSMLLRDRHPE